jgi:acyl-coenzyme A thioesterase PaaI-like protein
VALLERPPKALRSDPAAFAYPPTDPVFIRNVAAMTIAPDTMIGMGVAEVVSVLAFETSARMANAARVIAGGIVALAADASLSLALQTGSLETASAS